MRPEGPTTPGHRGRINGHFGSNVTAGVASPGLRSAYSRSRRNQDPRTSESGSAAIAAPVLWLNRLCLPQAVDFQVLTSAPDVVTRRAASVPVLVTASTVLARFRLDWRAESRFAPLLEFKSRLMAFHRVETVDDADRGDPGLRSHPMQVRRAMAANGLALLLDQRIAVSVSRVN